MNIFKKIIGVLLLIFAGLLSIATLAAFFNGIIDCSKKIMESSTTSGIAYSLGSLIALLFFVAIIYFTTKLGLKLIKKKPTEIVSIDEIGLEK